MNTPSATKSQGQPSFMAVGLYSTAYALYYVMCMIQIVYVPGQTYSQGLAAFGGLMMALAVLDLRTVPKPLLLVVTLMLGFCIQKSWLLRETPGVNPGYLIGAIGWGIHVSKGRLHPWVASLLFWGTVYYLAGRILAGEDPNGLFVSFSRNAVSYFVLSAAVVLHCSLAAQGRGLGILAAGATCAMALLGLGRGGVLSTALLVVALVAADTYQRARTEARQRFGWLLVVLPLTVAVGLGLWSVFQREAEAEFRERGVEDFARSQIWMEYLTRLSPEEILTGGDVRQDTGGMIAVEFQGNLHNAFLQAHASFGAASFGLVLLLASGFWRTLRTDPRTTAVLLAWIARNMTDAFCFVAEWDFAWFILLFTISRRPAEKTSAKKAMLKPATSARPQLPPAAEGVGLLGRPAATS